jgi:hypothetical protein
VHLVHSYTLPKLHDGGNRTLGKPFMFENRTITAHEYHLLRRLDAAGCPVNLDRLAQPCHPLQIIHEPAALGRELFPLGDQTGLAFRVSITAAVPFTISGIVFRTDWAPGGMEITWSNFCNQHHAYCFHGYRNGDVRIASDRVLNLKFGSNLRFKAGECVSGYIALNLNEVVLPRDKKPKATLLICDQFDKRYPYDFVFENSQRMKSTSDTDCNFISRAELDREREAYVEKEAARAQGKIAPKATTLTQALRDILAEVSIRKN